MKSLHVQITEFAAEMLVSARLRPDSSKKVRRIDGGRYRKVQAKNNALPVNLVVLLFSVCVSDEHQLSGIPWLDLT